MRQYVVEVYTVKYGQKYATKKTFKVEDDASEAEVAAAAKDLVDSLVVWTVEPRQCDDPSCGNTSCDCTHAACPCKDAEGL